MIRRHPGPDGSERRYQSGALFRVKRTGIDLPMMEIPMVNRVRENVSPSEITLDPKNANKGTERGQYQLDQSMREFGLGKIPVVDKNMFGIAGNKTIQAAIDAGLPIHAIQSQGDALIVHQRMDLDLMEDGGRARRLAYADNRTSQTGLEWDLEQMQRDHMEGAVDLTEFFFVGELEAMGVDVETELSGRDEPKESYKPENLDPPTDDPVSMGQVYRCGDHRLQIGQSIKHGDADVMLKAFEEYTGVICEIEDEEFTDDGVVW
jgi:hypothetical protein